MREVAKAMRVLVPVVLGLIVMPVLALAAPSAVSVTGTLEYVGPGTYRFDYTIENTDVQPALAGFIVFFDSDGLARADYVSHTAPAGWEEVFVLPEDPEGYWNVEWDEMAGTNRILPGETLGGFSVTFTWNDANSLPGYQFFEAWNGEAH
ncbi:MAG: hypothetical protein V2A71_08575, partial [Candidatus Eisenbacteria bacterium]